MRRGVLTIMGVLLGAILTIMTAPPVAAQTIIGSSATGDVAALNDSYPMPGEVVRSLGGVGPLTQYSFWMRTGSASLTVTPVIYEWDNLAPVGPPLWTGAPVTITSASFVETVFPANVHLDPTKTYWLAVAQTNPGEFGGLDAGTANNDPNGYYAYRRTATADWGRTLSGELHFSAVFADPIVPPGVPTLGEWAMILLALMLAGGAALHLHRRHAV